MAVSIRIVRAAARTTDGTQTFSASGMTDTPKAAIFELTLADANDTSKDGAMLCFGITDGTRQYSMVNASKHGVSPTVPSHEMSNTRCGIVLDPATGTRLGTLVFTSFGAGAVTVTWTWTGTPVAALVKVTLFGGTNLSAYAGDFTCPETTDTETNITTVGFMPDNVILANSFCTGWNLLGSEGNEDNYQIGFADRTAAISNISLNMQSPGGAGTTDSTNYVNTSRSNYEQLIAIEIRDYDAQGFSAWTRDAASIPVGGLKYFFLAMAYGGAAQHWIGTVTPPTAPGSGPVTAPGFTPQFVMQLVSGSSVIDLARITDASGAGSFGICSFTANEIFSNGICERDGVVTTDTESWSSAALRSRLGTPADTHIAPLPTMDALGWTPTYSAASGTRKWPTLAIGTTSMTNALGYEASEHRHGFQLLGCSNIHMRGLTIKEAGGDGIYLGPDGSGNPCSNIQIADVYCDNNYRNGLSITGARHVLVENSVFKNHTGTAPKSGIDCEPNDNGDPLVDIVVRTCRFDGNTLSGFVLGLNNLDATSEPVSVLVDQCISIGVQAHGLEVLNDAPGSIGPGGTIEFRDCLVQPSVYSGIYAAWENGSAITLKFTRCTLRSTAIPNENPIKLLINGAIASTGVGGIMFTDCKIYDTLNRAPLTATLNDGLLGSTVRISGTITVVNPALPLGAYSTGITGLTVTVVAA